MRKREIVIRLQLPEAPRKRWLVVGALAILGVSAAVYAAYPVPAFATGESLSSSKLSGFINGLDSRVSAIENAGVVNTTSAQNAIAGDKTFTGNVTPAGALVYTNGAKSYSLNASYCGKTAAMTIGTTVTSYASAKGLCETACSSARAHVCSAEELVRYTSTGGTAASGWYNTGVFGLDPTVSNASQNDCAGWSSGTATHANAIWGGAFPSGNVLCTNTTFPMLCCN